MKSKWNDCKTSKPKSGQLCILKVRIKKCFGIKKKKTEYYIGKLDDRTCLKDEVLGMNMFHSLPFLHWEQYDEWIAIEGDE